MKKLTKILSVLLLLCMFASLMPVAALATEATEEQTAVQGLDVKAEKTEEKTEEEVEETVMESLSLTLGAHQDHSWETDAVTHKCTLGGCEFETAQSHVWDAATGICTVCEYECQHDFNPNTSKCRICGFVCTGHYYGSDGVCDTCGKLEKPVACSGTGEAYVEYASLPDAIKAFNKGETVKMLNDCKAEGYYTLSAAGTLDLNQKTLSATDGKSFALKSTGNGVTVKNGTVNAGTMAEGAAIVCDGGAITLDGVTTAFGSGVVSAVDVAVNGGTCTIAGGNYLGSFAVSKGSLVINGGKFDIKPADDYLGANKGVLKDSKDKYVVSDFTKINDALSVNLLAEYKDGLTAAFFTDNNTPAKVVDSVTDMLNPEKIDGNKVDTQKSVTVTYSLEYVTTENAEDGDITKTFEVTPVAVVSYNDGKTADPRFNDRDLKFPLTANLSGVFNTPSSVEAKSSGMDSWSYDGENNTVKVTMSDNLVSNKFTVVYAAPDPTEQTVEVSGLTPVRARISSSSTPIVIDAAEVYTSQVKSRTANTVKVKGYHNVDKDLQSVLELLGFATGSVDKLTAVRVHNAAVVNTAADTSSLIISCIPSEKTLLKAADAGRGITVTFTAKAMKVIRDQLAGDDLVLFFSSNEDRTVFYVVALACDSNGYISSTPICTSSDNNVFANGSVLVELETKIPTATATKTFAPSKVKHTYGSLLNNKKTESFYNNKIAPSGTAENRQFVYADNKIPLYINSFSKFEVTLSELTLSPETGSSLGSLVLGEPANLKSVSADGEGKLEITAEWQGTKIAFDEDAGLEEFEKKYGISVANDTVSISGTPSDSNLPGIYTLKVTASDNLGNKAENLYTVTVTDANYQVIQAETGVPLGDYETLAQAVNQILPADVYVLKDRPDDSAQVQLAQSISNIYGNNKQIDSIDFLYNVHPQDTEISNITMKNLTLGVDNATLAGIIRELSDDQALFFNGLTLKNVTVTDGLGTGTVMSYGTVDGENIEILNGKYDRIQGDAAADAYLVSGGNFGKVLNYNGVELTEFPVKWLLREEASTSAENDTQYVGVKQKDGSFSVVALSPDIVSCSNSRTFVKNSAGSLTFGTNIPYSVIDEYYEPVYDSTGKNIIGFKDKEAADDDDPEVFSVYVGSTRLANSEKSQKYTFSKGKNGYLYVTLTNTYLKTLASGTKYLTLKTDMGDTVKADGVFYVSASGRTGDTANMGLWIGIMLACVVAAAVVVVVVRKKQGKPLPFSKKKD